MASSTQTGSPDPAVILKEITESVSNYILESVQDFQDFVDRPRIRHWLRIIVIVAGYIMVRPLIELFFKKIFEKQTAKEEAALKQKREEEDEQLVAEGLKKAKKDGNSMRVGRSVGDKTDAAAATAAADGSNDGSKAAEGNGNKNKDDKNNKSASTTTSTSNNKDEYENSDEEDFAEKIRASGVLEWGRDARKRQKKGGAAAKTTESGRKVEQMDEEKLMELLDWSEDEDGQKRPKQQ